MTDIAAANSIPACWPSSWAGRAAAWTAFALALGFSLLVLVDSNLAAIPFMRHDEWTVSTKIVSLPFMEATLAGHKYPLYLQNAIWWMDYHWLDYRGTLPLVLHLACMAIGFTTLFATLARAGFSGAAVALSAFAWLCLWLSLSNMPQYSGTYRWRTVEASGIFALIGLCLLLAESAWRNSLAGKQAYPQLAALVFLAWCGLFLHGGMVLLPIFLLILALSPEGRRYWPAAGVILAAFCIQFLLAYDLQSTSGGGDQGWRELLTGCVYLLTSLPYVMLRGFSASLANVVSAVLACAGLGAAAYLGGKLLLRRLNMREMVALALLLYPILITLIIAFFRIAENGATFALAGRYRNYSIYLVIGLVVLCLDTLSCSRNRPAVRAGATGLLSLCLGLAGLGLLTTALNFPALSNNLQARAADVIPYSFTGGEFPPMGSYGTLRANRAKEYRNVLLSRESSVFGAPEYRAYSAALVNGLAVDSPESCFEHLVVIKSKVVESGTLVRVSAELARSWSAQGGFVIFADPSGRPLGWGFRHLSLGQRLQGLLAGRNGNEQVFGWALLETESPPAHAALVDKKNQVVCATSLVWEGARKGAPD